jgi:hypothetical protein
LECTRSPRLRLRIFRPTSGFVSSELSSTLAVKLFKVFLRDSADVWILIHLKVQSQRDADFARRMFVYHYRILDRYNRDVVSLAILELKLGTRAQNSLRKCVRSKASRN